MPTNEQEDKEALKLLLRSFCFTIINIGRAIRDDVYTPDSVSTLIESFDELADRAHEFYKPY